MKNFREFNTKEKKEKKKVCFEQEKLKKKMYIEKVIYKKIVYRKSVFRFKKKNL